MSDQPRCEYCSQYLSDIALDKMYKGDFSECYGEMLYTMYPTPEPWGEVFWHVKCKDEE